MAAARNKALLSLAGRPVLRHSVETFQSCCDRVLVIAAPADVADIQALLLGYVEVVAGGATRHGSEWNALAFLRSAVTPSDVIALHDAARPLVSAADVRAVLAAAAAHGAAMLAAPAELPALTLEAGQVARAYASSELWRAQTPQAARAACLLEAYDRAAQDAFDGTDTAAVLAHAGFSVHLVPATAPNPKITVPADLVAAGALARGDAG